MSQQNSSLLELAWAAGFFDGEGSTFAHSQNGTRNRNGYVTLKLSISQVDRAPLERFLKAVGEGYINGPYEVAKTKRGRPSYLYRATGEAAERVLEQLTPYLCGPKLRQAVEARVKVDAIREEIDARRFVPA